MKLMHCCILGLFVSPTPINSICSTFTHTVTHGRLGDHLISYAQCKFLSWYHGVPMLYHPKLSNQFSFAAQEKPLTHALRRTFKKIKKISADSALQNLKDDTLYELSYKIKIDGGIVYQVWKHPDFAQLLKAAWQPKIPIEYIPLPHNMITVALHIRKGSGRDHPLRSEQIYQSNFIPTATKKSQPKQRRSSYSDTGPHVLKFPPEQYYIDHLILISELLNDPPLYVYLFTDSHNPEELAQRIETYVHKKNMTFDYNRDQQRASNKQAVFQDFFSMARFDILIRSESNFSKAAQLIGDHTLGMYPQKFHWDNNKLIIDESCALVRYTKEPYVKNYRLPHDTTRLKIDIGMLLKK